MTRSRGEQGPTLWDVAERAGLSAMTVSRVINGKTNVKGRTRAAVEEAIRTLGYVPRIPQRYISSYANNVLGIIYSNRAPHFTGPFLTGIVEEASSYQMRLVMLPGQEGQIPVSQLKKLISSGVGGFILGPPFSESPTLLDALRNTGLPIAAVGAHSADDAICIRIDDRRAAFDMTKYLLELGHRRLGFIVGNPNQSASAERLSGFHAAVRTRNDLQIAVAQGDYSFASGIVATESLLGASAVPTAIFASNDDMAAAAISVAQRRQLKVPDDLTIVGFDDAPTSSMFHPSLTTVHQPIRDLGANAVRALRARILDADGPSGQGEDVVLQHRIVERESSSKIVRAWGREQQLVTR